MFESFSQIQRDFADRLAIAAGDRKSPMHTPVVTTADVDSRVMVLRDYDASTSTLRFHTDARAPKVNVIEEDPRVSVLLYDQPSKIQIRASGVGRIERDSVLAQRAWDKSDNFARRCYLGAGPGSHSDSATSGLPAQFEGIEPTDEELIPARPNFAILLVELTKIDWFYLAHTGHVRAQFEKDESGEWAGRWVAP